MNAEKTPLVQKLILAVLSLILVCLVVLIAQNRARRSASVAAENNVTEHESMSSEVAPEPGEVVARQLAPKPSPKVPPAERRPPVSAIPQPVMEPTRLSMQPETPPPLTALVNPVGREPLEIVLHAGTPVLRTEICGRVRLEGTPPSELPIRMDSRCAQLHEGLVTTRHYVVGHDRGLANVLVYIQGDVPKRNHPSSVPAPVISATACFFEPYVLGMQAGQKLTVQNFDDMRHNFQSVSKSNRNFNVVLSFPGHTTQRGFENPEVFVRLKCNVHAWESAHIGIVPHPFFAVTDTNGIFCLPPGLPHGRYVLAAVHPKAGETLREIIVTETQLDPIELAFSVPRR